MIIYIILKMEDYNPNDFTSGTPDDINNYNN